MDRVADSEIALEPVHRLPGEQRSPPRDGTALSLSGGGYRAMLFHVGVLWRLLDSGYLRRVDRISSVSGGSITAGVLALAWDRLRLADDGAVDRYVELVVAPLRQLAGTTIDKKSVIAGLLRRDTIGERVAAAYREQLFGRRTLQHLPAAPRFVFNATNMDSGALWRFSRPYMGDWRVGRIEDPEVELAAVVAASSAFPPILSPFPLDLRGARWVTDPGNDLAEPEHRGRILLSDGGVYDNLGLETAWKSCRTVLVSDAGGKMEPDPSPAKDWPRHTLRVLKVIDTQVRALRKRQVIASFKAPAGDVTRRHGAYLGIRSDIGDYRLDDALPCPHRQTLELAKIPTRLGRLEPQRQQQLVNWGYAIGDAALRRHVDTGIAPPGGFPYDGVGVG
jgi:NTE family protein